jgi:hypothetical protein
MEGLALFITDGYWRKFGGRKAFGRENMEEELLL